MLISARPSTTIPGTYNVAYSFQIPDPPSAQPTWSTITIMFPGITLILGDIGSNGLITSF